MKKIAVVLGCRKNGNTEEIVNYFISSLEKYTAIEKDYIYLYDYSIPFCVGCHNCIFEGEEKCSASKIVKEIEEKILLADGIILASPGYMFSVTAIMKNFLDHVAYNCHRPKYFGKQVYILSSCTKWQKEGVFIPMETWASGAGASVVDKTFVDLLPFPQTEKELDKKRKIIEKASQTYAKALLSCSDVLEPKFGDFMIFNMFRMLSKLFPNILKADYRYYHEKISEEDKWHIKAKIKFFPYFMAKRMISPISKYIRKTTDFSKVASFKRNKL